MSRAPKNPLLCSTTTLALGSRQLAAQGAIVTRLTAIEEMAGMTLLCSDKTGTLTLNQMVIQVRLGHALFLLKLQRCGNPNAW